MEIEIEPGPLFFNPEDGGRSRFALTDGATPRSAQTGPFLKGKAAFFATSRFDDEPLGTGRLCDMFQMVKDLFLFNAEQAGKVSHVETFFLQSLGHLLP
jgi:hypothetical protein